MTNLVPTPTVPAPDIVRCAYMEIVVTDLAYGAIAKAAGYYARRTGARSA